MPTQEYDSTVMMMKPLKYVIFQKVYMLVPILAKSPYVYRNHHTGMGTHTRIMTFYDTVRLL